VSDETICEICGCRLKYHHLLSEHMADHRIAKLEAEAVVLRDVCGMWHSACDQMQAYVQKYEIGLAGDRVFDNVLADAERLREALVSEARRIAKLEAKLSKSVTVGSMITSGLLKAAEQCEKQEVKIATLRACVKMLWIDYAQETLVHNDDCPEDDTCECADPALLNEAMKP